MSARGDGFLHELELEVREELILTESGGPEDLPVGEWLFDPADAERDQVGLQALLGAVQALEDGPRTADE
ncbi:hypothetical protein [Actinoallomurus iriomotensis]|uniref:Uncharacterized protein n=1 Tax=Actinoallomurus iriomotensis TaxID=478107 RepID=A0A9W6SCD1_9ACTN|nr:hypothetical protein [Actinoallomurus iriomotensis]GLY91294.1 hypothetical protein Airi02_092230 [Actinoallomurus iriomotensis]